LPRKYFKEKEQGRILKLQTSLHAYIKTHASPVYIAVSEDYKPT